MTGKNEQQNLIDDLKAPIKSFRIFALEEVIKSGASPEILAALQEISRFEDDAECLMLINHAISSVKSRISGAQSAPAASLSEQNDFIAAWNKADDDEKMRILSDLPVRLPKGLRPLGPELVAASASPVITARIIRVFCRSWPEDQFDRIAGYLDAKSLTLKLAVLKTIVHMKPELLMNDLPGLLSSRDPQIKALAIRGLAKIDKEEALNHLQALLLSPDLSDRLAGIQNCPFLPFEMVKPVLLKYFAAENHPELLIRAGWILEMNPDVQVPFKLFEIAERSPSKKAELVKGILNEAVKLLEKSGILGSQFTAYTRKLQAWVVKRNALRFAKQVVVRLESEIIDPELDQTIRNSLKQAVIVEALTEALTWPVSETVRSRLGVYLKGAGSAENEPAASEPLVTRQPTAEKTFSAVPSAAAPPPTLNLAAKDDKGRIETFATLEAEAASPVVKEICQLVAARETAVEVKVAALHCMSRLKLKGLEEVSVRLIGGNNVGLATAAVEYLGVVDPDAIFPYLGQCLKVADVRMKSAALGILKNFDFNQAVSSLNAMLRSSDHEQQRMALECMDQFDFALIREQLTDYLCRCDDETLAEAGLCHFAANPAAENVYSLYKIEKAHQGKIAHQAGQLRESCRAAGGEVPTGAASTPADEVPQAEEALQERWRAEQEKKKSSRPAYAYRSPAEEVRLTPRQTLTALFETAKEFASAKSSWIALAILLVFAAGFYVFFVPRGSEAGPAAGSAIIVDQYVREGKITRVVGAAVEFESTQGEKFVLTPAREGYRVPGVGARLRVSLVPFRRGPDNTYLARIRSLRPIEEFTPQTGGDGK